MKNKEIGIITSGFLPVPATKGGAVENLLVNMINKNEEEKKLNIAIFSIYDEQAVIESKKYKKTRFIFIKPNFVTQVLDKIIYFFAKNILKKKNSQSYRYILQRLEYLNKVSKMLKKEDFDKILLENHPTQYLALKWRKNYIKYNNRYYYHCHNEFPGEYGCHDIIIKTKNIICVSEYIKKCISKYLNCSENISVLRNGIDEEKFKIDLSKEEIKKLKTKYNIKDNDIVLIFTGRVVPEKGVLELIKAVKNIKNDNMKLLIVGAALNALNAKSKYEEEVEKVLSDVKDKIIFTGFVNYTDIPKLYNIANIAVVPSIWNDPAPLTVIESLTCGLPVITTNSGGIPEYANDKCAIILKRDESLTKELEKNISKLINDKEKILTMSKESIKAAQKLTINNYYNDFLELINDKEK